MAASTDASPIGAVVQQKLGTAELLFQCAQKMNLQPSWVSPNGLIAITVDGNEQYINLTRSPLNTATGVSISRNKYLTRLVLERNGIQNIPFMRPQTLEEATAFLEAHTKIIAKPVGGSGAHDIHIVTSATQLEGLAITGYILEKYILGQEFRYLVLNSKVIGVHRSEYGVSVAETRDLERISYPEETWDDSLIRSSLQITKILGLTFAAVDYLIDDLGQAHILEVNTTPGIKWFHAPSSGPVVDVARQFLEAIVTPTSISRNDLSFAEVIHS